MAALMDPRLASQPPQQLGAVTYSGFPVRKITQKLNSKSGEWVIAYQADQRRHLQAVIVPLVKEHARRSKILRPPTNTREASGVPRVVLDRAFLLKHCYGREPGDLCICNVSGKGLQDYKCEDFAQFINVVSINASDNYLPLEAFHAFPVLEELELSLNVIVDISLEPGYLASLHRLDLSYNYLSEEALLALGTLPLLKELHLTGNNIVALPVEMSRPYPNPNPDQSSAMGMRYPCLEKLWLDDNKLTDQSTFATLAGMRKLRYLNLDNNELYTIPHLKLLGTSPLKPAKSTEQMPYTSSSLESDGTPALIHSNSTLPVSRGREEGNQIIIDDAKENDRVGASKEDWAVADAARDDATTKPTTEEEEESSDPRTTKSEPSLVAHQNMENVSKEEVEEKISSTSEQAIPSDVVTVSEKSSEIPIHSGVSQVKSEPSMVHQSAKTDSKVEAEDTSGEKILPYTEASPSGHTTTTPPLHADTTPPPQIDQSACTSPNSDVGEEGRVGNLQPVGGNDEKSKELAPFPQLETLSLVKNLILREESVVACSTWPVLKELIIYGNPLTRTAKGIPPLLKSHLVDGCGINVVRKKPGLKKRHHIGKVAKDFKKVSSAPPPTIPKYPLPALEAPPLMNSRMLEGIPSFPPSPSSSHHSFSQSESPSTLQQSSFSDTAHEPVGADNDEAGGQLFAGIDGLERNAAQDKDTQGVFLTQVDGEEPTERAPCQGQTEGVGVSTLDQETAREEFRARVEDLKHKHKTLPTQYRGYEALMDTFDDPAISVPQDLYGCTRALKHALKHPLILSDSHSKAPSVSSHSGSSQTTTTGQYLKKKPAVMSVVPSTVQTDHKVQQLKEVLDEIRTQCNTVETNLASVLEPEHSAANASMDVMAEGRRSIAELQRERKRLLAEMQARYDEVRAQSLSVVQTLSDELHNNNIHGQRQSSRKKRTSKTSARVTFSSQEATRNSH